MSDELRRTNARHVITPTPTRPTDAPERVLVDVVGVVGARQHAGQDGAAGDDDVAPVEAGQRTLGQRLPTPLKDRCAARTSATSRARCDAGAPCSTSAGAFALIGALNGNDDVSSSSDNAFQLPHRRWLRTRPSDECGWAAIQLRPSSA